MTTEADEARKARIEASIDGFMNRLPTLLKEHEGRWTAFRGDECLGIWDSTAEAQQSGVDLGGALFRKISQEYVEFGRYGKPVYLPRASLDL